jgi:hypothetical protein
MGSCCLRLCLRSCLSLCVFRGYQASLWDVCSAGGWLGVGCGCSGWQLTDGRQQRSWNAWDSLERLRVGREGDGKQLEPDEVKQVSLDLAAPIVYEYGSPTTSGRRFDGWVAN